MDDDFRALIDSLGNMAISRVGPYGVNEVRVMANEDLYTAQVTACVSESLTDAAYAELYEQLLAVRLYYLDELSVSFAVNRCDLEDHDASAEATGSREFAYAG